MFIKYMVGTIGCLLYELDKTISVLEYHAEAFEEMLNCSGAFINAIRRANEKYSSLMNGKPLFNPGENTIDFIKDHYPELINRLKTIYNEAYEREFGTLDR